MFPDSPTKLYCFLRKIKASQTALWPKPCLRRLPAQRMGHSRSGSSSHFPGMHRLNKSRTGGRELWKLWDAQTIRSGCGTVAPSHSSPAPQACLHTQQRDGRMCCSGLLWACPWLYFSRLGQQVLLNRLPAMSSHHKFIGETRPPTPWAAALYLHDIHSRSFWGHGPLQKLSALKIRSEAGVTCGLSEPEEITSPSFCHRIRVWIWIITLK